MNIVRRVLQRWLFPEYKKYAADTEKVRAFMEEVMLAKEHLRGYKTVTFKEPVVFLGSLTNCQVDLKPTLKPEIVLSKLELKSLLELSGNHHTVTSSMFASKEMPKSALLNKK